MSKIYLLSAIILVAVSVSGCEPLSRSDSYLKNSSLYGSKSLPEPDFSPREPSVKVVTYNVNWGFSNPQKVTDYLLSADADVICLQETHRQWELFLKNRLGQSYRYSAFKNSGGAGGIAVMSKYPLHNVKSLPPDSGWFPALLAEVDKPLGRVQFLNVHLKPPLSDRGSPSVSALYSAPKIHKKELDQFLKQVNQTKPLIVAGDFNENESNEAVRSLLDRDMTDALSLYDKKSNTWVWKLTKGITLTDRLDHIIFNKYLSCTGARVTRVEASDHMPVLAVFVQDKGD